MKYSILQMSPERILSDEKNHPFSRETYASVQQTAARDSDAALAAGMACRDANCLEEVYRLYAPRLMAYLLARLGDRSLAEDTLQEVMLSAWKGAAHFRGECRLYTWLLSIARNQAINAYNRQLKPLEDMVSLEDADPPLRARDASPEDHLGEFDDLQAALGTLTSEQRETLELVFYHELSLEETALVLGMATGTVKSRLHRARQRLRELLGGQIE